MKINAWLVCLFIVTRKKWTKIKLFWNHFMMALNGIKNSFTYIHLIALCCSKYCQCNVITLFGYFGGSEVGIFWIGSVFGVMLKLLAYWTNFVGTKIYFCSLKRLHLRHNILNSTKSSYNLKKHVSRPYRTPILKTSLIKRKFCMKIWQYNCHVSV
jgi:hypothetical protein